MVCGGVAGVREWLLVEADIPSKPAEPAARIRRTARINRLLGLTFDFILFHSTFFLSNLYLQLRIARCEG